MQLACSAFDLLADFFDASADFGDSVINAAPRACCWATGATAVDEENNAEQEK